MSWSEVRRIPNDYNKSVKEIDEQLISLIAARQSLTKGKRSTPSYEQIKDWAQVYGVDEAEIGSLFHQLQSSSRPSFPNKLGQLLNVVPIMKKSTVDSCEYVLTHAMQHEYASIVFIEIKLLQDEKASEIHLKPNLTLEVTSEQPYSVRRYSGRGGGSKTELQFMISPPLPERIDGVEFSLVPSTLYKEHEIAELVLDKQVDFE